MLFFSFLTSAITIYGRYLNPPLLINVIHFEPYKCFTQNSQKTIVIFPHLRYNKSIYKIKSQTKQHLYFPSYFPPNPQPLPHPNVNLHTQFT